MKKLGVLIFIFLLILILSLFLIFWNFDNKKYTGQAVLDNQNVNNSETISAHVVSEEAGFPHYSRSEVYYSFINETLCGKMEPQRVRRAFVEVENQTGFLKFKDISESENADIVINCSREVPAGEDPGYTISGRGSYSYVGNRIIQGKIQFYNCKEYSYSPGCVNFPDVEIHEILHTFGIQHSNDTKSIMYPIYQNCRYKIDEEIISDLREVYAE